MIKLTFELENMYEDVDQALATLSAIRATRRLPEMRVSRIVEATSAGDGGPDYRVSAWFPRLGQGSRSFWERAAIYFRDHAELTFEALATSEAEKQALRSYHRNSYRAINAEGAPNPLESRWDYQAGHQVYRMPDAVRDAILSLTSGSE
jgi:hypothetical protein